MLELGPDECEGHAGCAALCLGDTLAALLRAAAEASECDAVRDPLSHFAQTAGSKVPFEWRLGTRVINLSARGCATACRNAGSECVAFAFNTRVGKGVCNLLQAGWSEDNVTSARWWDLWRRTDYCVDPAVDGAAAECPEDFAQHFGEPLEFHRLATGTHRIGPRLRVDQDSCARACVQMGEICAGIQFNWRFQRCTLLAGGWSVVDLVAAENFHVLPRETFCLPAVTGGGDPAPLPACSDDVTDLMSLYRVLVKSRYATGDRVLAVHRDTGYLACAGKCNSRHDCTGFELNTRKDTCVLVTNTGLGTPTVTRGAWRTYARLDSCEFTVSQGTPVCPAAPLEHFGSPQEARLRLWGRRTIGVDLTVTGPEECAALCTGLPAAAGECRAFEFRPHNSLCSLKSAAPAEVGTVDNARWLVYARQVYECAEAADL